MNKLSNVFNQELQKLHNLKTTEIEENQVTEKIMTTKELASVLGVSERTIRDTAKNKGVEGTFHTLKTKGGTQSVKVYTEEQATLIEQEIRKQQKWYTIEDLASMCGISVETLKKGNSPLNNLSIDFEVESRLGGNHNTKKFYSGNVLKALKEYLIKNSVQNATKNKETVLTGNISHIQTDTFNKTMTVKQVAETFEVSPEAIKQVVRKLFPNKMQNGKTTYLNEQEIACISKEMKTSFHLVHTEPTRIPCRLETTTELEILANYKAATDAYVLMLERKNEEKDRLLEQQKPKVDYYDKFIDSTNLIEIGHLGKSTGIGEQKIFKRLVAEGYIKVRYSTDGVKYYDPCYGFEKYFKSVSVPFLRGEKQLNREKLMLTSDGYAYFMKKMGA